MSDNEALADSDYIAKSSFAFIREGEQCTTVTFNIIDDETPEATETFLVTLSNAFNAEIADGEGMVTILDTQQEVHIPSININDVTVFEDEGIAELNICLDQATTLPVSVFYATADQSAQEIKDFQFANDLATFAPGETCMTITINIEEDRVDEQDEVFVVNLSGPSNATLADAQGTVTIIDNDEPSIGVIIPNLTISDITVEENQSYAHLQVCLDQPASQAVTIECTTVNGTAVAGSDFVAATDVLTIPAGQTCHQTSFSIIDDNESEETETFFIEISNAVGATIQDGTGEVTIFDNDDSETINPTCPDLAVSSGTNTITIGNLLAPVEIVQVFNSANQVVFQCLNNCDAVEIVDNLPAGDYTVIINCYDNAFGLLCREEFHVTVSDGSSPAPAGCQGNVLFGGSINGQESICGAFDPSVIGNASSPDGGDNSVEIEYLWLASTQGCPRELVDQIPGATGPTYDPGTITQTTYFVRCARRKGCNVWVESNCVVKEVSCPDDANNMLPDNAVVTDCGDIIISYGGGIIKMESASGQSYLYKVNHMVAGSPVVHDCQADCGDVQKVTGLATGSYNVTIFNPDGSVHCNKTIELTNTLTDKASTSRSTPVTSADKAVKPIEKEKATASTTKAQASNCLLYTSPSPRDRTRSRMPSSA